MGRVSSAGAVGSRCVFRAFSFTESAG
jgi:hypothetical protein